MTDQATPLGLTQLHRILEDAAAAHSVEQLIDRLVIGVRGALETDVCSLYQADTDGVLHLVASSGLAETAVGSVRLPVGQGLAGFVAETQLPLNIQNAAAHPRFVHFPDVDSEALNAYLAVPVVYLGKTIGVIVLQDRRERAFSAVEQSFLFTVAAQLSGSLIRLPLPQAAGAAGASRRVQGVAGAPGKALGALRLVVSHRTLQLVDEPAPRGAATELELLSEAIESTRQDIAASKARLTGSSTGDIVSLFDFYELMLTGDLRTQAEVRIGAGTSAFAAVRQIVDDYVAAFEAIQDEYLRARAEDVRHLGDKLLSAILNPAGEPSDDEADVVLFGELVSVTDIGRYRPDQLAAVVSMQGSALSHTAILARALGIPAVMGIGPIDHISDGERIVVDGDDGSIILNPTRALEATYRKAVAEAGEIERRWLDEKHLPAVTTDGHAVVLLANTGLLSDVSPGLARGAEGIGLFRSEIPFLAHETFPTEEEQLEIYRHLLETYHPLPVTIRVLDIGSDKELPYLRISEANPGLGWRGIRFALDNRPVLVSQLRAILRAHLEFGNARIMIPMVSHMADVTGTAEILDGILRELSCDEPVARPPLGVMVEVPGLIALLPHLAASIDFVSIGSNDLTQYLLAVDRGNARVAGRYDPLHPGVLRFVEDVLRECARLDIDASLCGEMAADPVAVVLLLAMGLDTFSMSAASLPRIRALIRRLSLAEAKETLAQVRGLSAPEDIRRLVADHLSSLDLGSLLTASPQPAVR